jgi:YD repeat-containing protein
LDHQFGYDSFDRLSLLTAPDLATTAIARTSKDDVAAVMQDAEAKLNSYEYDDLGRQVVETLPDSGATIFEYDAAGNLITKTNGRGSIVTYTYDAEDYQPLYVPGSEKKPLKMFLGYLISGGHPGSPDCE